MVVADVPGDDRESLPFADELEYPLELLFTVDVGKDFAPVAGYPYDAVLARVGGMFQPNSCRPSRKRRSDPASK